MTEAPPEMAQAAPQRTLRAANVIAAAENANLRSETAAKQDMRTVIDVSPPKVM